MTSPSVPDGSDQTQRSLGERERRTEYLEERQLLIDAEREASRTFDKEIVTLSAGALGLSLALLHQFPRPGSKTFLFVAWGAFISSALLILVSQLTSQEAMRIQRQRLDESYTSGARATEGNRFMAWTKQLNVASVFFFIMGVVFLLIFSALSIGA